MTLPRWWPAPALLVGLLLWRAHDGAVGREGALTAQVKALETARADLLAHQHVVDTAYVHDTVTLTRFRTRLDTLLVDRHITDTVWVKNFIQVADSTVLACSAAITTCGARVAVRDSMITNLRSTLAAERKRRPGFLRRTFGCAAGLAGTGKGLGLGGACGVKF